MNHRATRRTRAKVRLLVLSSTYPRWTDDPEPGFVHELARRMTDRFDVTVLTPHAMGAALDEQLDGVNVVRYRYAPERLQSLIHGGGIVSNLRRNRWKWLLVPGLLLAQLFATRRLIRQLQPDVVHAHWLIPQGLAMTLVALFTRAPPIVVTSHGTDLFAFRGWPFTWLKLLVTRRASVLTVVSKAMRDEVLRMRVDPARVAVEPMGVDLQHRFTVDPTVQRSTTEILFVGRLLASKGLSRLIDALPAVLEKVPDAHLTVAGFGPEEQVCRAQVIRLGLEAKVSFCGAMLQRELPNLYRRAAVFVAPFVKTPKGEQEGLGLVLVEAAGCGCPVVAGDVPAVADVVASPAVGIRVQSADSQALSAAICDVLAHVHTAESSTARAQAVQHFDWAKRAGAYADLLSAAVNSSGLSTK
jgi:glycosyltransferase involved in cell wall biosynthesis